MNNVKIAQLAILSSLAHTEGRQLPDLYLLVSGKLAKAGSTDMIFDFIYPMKDLGWLVKVDTTWSLTLGGYAAYNLLKKEAEREEGPLTIASGPSGPSTESYQGLELREQVGRAGAYDAFKCPSRYGDNRVMRSM